MMYRTADAVGKPERATVEVRLGTDPATGDAVVVDDVPEAFPIAEVPSVEGYDPGPESP